MKLDSLKDAWQHYAAQAAAVHRVTEDQISGLLKTRTENAVTKLKRNIYFELGMLLFTVLYFGVNVVMVQDDPAFKILCMVIVVICLPFLGYFWGRLQYLRRLNVTTENLRGTLSNLTEMLTGLTKLYFWSNVLFAPIGLAAGQLIYLKLGEGINISHLPWEQLSLRLLIGFVIGGVFGYFFLRWYIRQMFGNHLTNLKGALHELESLEMAA
ncbi:hypothetical protein GU926_12310 [Nibribacter ruber]|uniref:Uncharacterized protein n=1 Tax=Nibribacter ruber TaxID=2698458 RepID=A0A6P1P1S2_9BACT|nr:hypothetical protein [Nibribacter ruber]QHL88173.1 hypothetical protein GU926_12310 [Nibribacter ruber]